MHELNFKAYFEAEASKQGDFITSLTSVLGISPKHVKKALDGTSPIMMSQKVFGKKQIGLSPVTIDPDKEKDGASISIDAESSPYVYINDRLNRNTKRKIRAFVGRDQMNKLYTMGFPGSEGKPEGEAAPPDLGGGAIS